MKYVIRGAKDDDAQELAEIMRDLDRNELWAASMSMPLPALQKGMAKSDEVFTALADGVPYCMFGVLALSSLGGGSPWLLTSQDVVKHRKELLRWSRPVAHTWARKYGHLLNYIDSRHAPALRWARWTGFTVHDPKPHGLSGRPFNKITMSAE